MYFVPAPEFISVICPKCEKYATFKKSVGVANIEKADRKYFENSKHFDTFYTKHYGRYQYEVWYDAGLSNPLDNIHDLPEVILREFLNDQNICALFQIFHAELSLATTALSAEEQILIGLNKPISNLIIEIISCGRMTEKWL